MNGVRKAMPLRPSQDSGYAPYPGNAQQVQDGGYAPYPGKSQQGQDGGYGSRQQNSQDSSRSMASQGSRGPSPPRINAAAVLPNGNVVLEGYRKDLVSNYEGDKQRFNPVSVYLDSTLLGC